MRTVSVAEYYDALFADPDTRAYFGGRGWCNYGLWDGAKTPADAGDALLEAVLAPVRSTPARVLDVGCGHGEACARMHDRWPTAAITGVNISAEQLDVARREVPGVRFLQADAVDLMLIEDGEVDLVVVLEAAFHFAPRARFFREAERVLRPGGLLVMSDAMIAAGSGPLRDLWPAANVVDNIAHYHVQVLDAGLTDVAIRDVSERVFLPMMAYRRRRAEALCDAGAITAMQLAGRLQRIDSIPRVFLRYLLVVAQKA